LKAPISTKVKYHEGTSSAEEQASTDINKVRKGMRVSRGPKKFREDMLSTKEKAYMTYEEETTSRVRPKNRIEASGKVKDDVFFSLLNNYYNNDEK
jgi:hypothetical protein